MICVANGSDLSADLIYVTGGYSHIHMIYQDSSGFIHEFKRTTKPYFYIDDWEEISKASTPSGRIQTSLALAITPTGNREKYFVNVVAQRGDGSLGLFLGGRKYSTYDLLDEWKKPGGISLTFFYISEYFPKI